MPQKPYKLVFFGTSEFAVPILERLRADGDFSILEVVTQPDRPAGRKKTLTAPPVKRAAETFGVPVYQPESIKDADALSHFEKLGADVFVVVAYGKILPQRLLSLPPSGGINVHASILPAYRGASPISAAIAAGEQETGVTIMKMDAKMDEGPTLDVVRVPIANDDTTETLTPKLARAGAELIAPTLKLYLEGLLEPKPQDPSKASYTRVLERADGRIDWTASAVDIDRFIRAMQPWPEAFTMCGHHGQETKLTIKKASVLHPTSDCGAEGRVGAVCRLADGTVGVNCGTGSIVLHVIQLEGGKAMDAVAFLNGHPSFIGAQLA